MSHARTSISKDSKKNSITIINQLRDLQARINALLEESYENNADSKYISALEKAIEAKELSDSLGSKLKDFLADDMEISTKSIRPLIELYFSETSRENSNYAVSFNLAYQYESSGKYEEAIKFYQQLNKYKHNFRSKINIANVYCKRGLLDQGLKYFRMALDQIPESFKLIRIKTMINIGLVMLKSEKYSDALTCFQHVASEAANQNYLTEDNDANDASKENANLENFGGREDIYKEILVRVNTYLIYTRCKILKQKPNDTNAEIHIEEKNSELISLIKKDFERLLTFSTNSELRTPFKEHDLTSNIVKPLTNDRQTDLKSTILNLIYIISPLIDRSFQRGFQWCMKKLIESPNFNISGIEMFKAWWYIKNYNFVKAAEIYKNILDEILKDNDCKKDESTWNTLKIAGLNLSFLYIIRQDYKKAEECLENILRTHGDFPQALINRGNVHLYSNQTEKAIECYEKTLKVIIKTSNPNTNNTDRLSQKLPETDRQVWLRAKFNLGLAYRKLENFEKSVKNWVELEKEEAINSIQENDDDYNYDSNDENEYNVNTLTEPKNVDKIVKQSIGILEVNDQMGLTYMNMQSQGFEDMSQQALNCYLKNLSIYPSNPDTLTKLAQIYDYEGLNPAHAKSRAFDFYSEAHKFAPADLTVIEWLAGYYLTEDGHHATTVATPLIENAMTYLTLASKLEPDEIKWDLALASCHKKLGEMKECYEIYRNAHRKYPRNVECLTLLTRLSKEWNPEEYYVYETELKALENSSNLKIQRSASLKDAKLDSMNQAYTGPEIEESSTLPQIKNNMSYNAEKNESNRDGGKISEKSSKESGDDDSILELLP
ncbi:unnamed protein product [Gordionus sp. m RMFG-2023]|uniref:intraflagellar transport protein 88 homolog n=1 Tax=Gordionus sp. m RMFG-2023 TaxID=3053472 RepID=UPI0030E141C9